MGFTMHGRGGTESGGEFAEEDARARRRNSDAEPDDGAEELPPGAQGGARAPGREAEDAA